MIAELYDYADRPRRNILEVLSDFRHLALFIYENLFQERLNATWKIRNSH